MSEPLDLPDGWNYGPDRRPPRSLLAGIDPIGVGTQFAESLAGYAVRLSWRHGHALARLVRDVLAPALGHPSAVDADRAAWEEELARVTRHASGSILGHAPVAGTWADALGAAIGRPVLRCLTTLAWADVLPSKRLLRAVRAWCPACLEIRRLRGLPAYEPLLWQFTEVTACVEHEVTLVTACPSCGMEGGVLTAWARAGWCRCGTWLGSLWFHEDAIIDGEDLDWQRFVTAQVGAMIAATPNLPGPVSAARTADAVRLCWTRSGLSLTRLASEMGMAVSTISLWKDGRRQPSLPGALRLCRATDVSLVDFLLGNLEAIAAAPAADGDRRYVRPSDERHTLHDWAIVRERLAAELVSDPPPSLAAVLRGIGIDTRQAKRECPEECARLAERHREWTDLRVQARRAEKARLVRAAIAAIHAEGGSTSRHQVQKRLPSWVSLREKVLFAIWVAEAREPGRRFMKV